MQIHTCRLDGTNFAMGKIFSIIKNKNTTIEYTWLFILIVFYEKNDNRKRCFLLSGWQK